jgi:hypothetical protein
VEAMRKKEASEELNWWDGLRTLWIELQYWSTNVVRIFLWAQALHEEEFVNCIFSTSVSSVGFPMRGATATDWPTTRFM